MDCLFVAFCFTRCFTAVVKSALLHCFHSLFTRIQDGRCEQPGVDAGVLAYPQTAGENGDNAYFKEFSGERHWDLTVYIVSLVVLAALVTYQHVVYPRFHGQATWTVSGMGVSMALTLISYVGADFAKRGLLRLLLIVPCLFWDSLAPMHGCVLHRPTMCQ